MDLHNCKSPENRYEPLTFMGRGIAQEPQDMLIWEKFFADNPIKTLIEFGTGHGGLTLYFGLKCREVGAKLYTYDNVRSTDFMMPIEIELGLASSFECIDIFSDVAMAKIGQIITTCEKPLLIFFDNGNKPREWKIYAPLTKPGDFCVVHDWETEFTASDLNGLPVERILTKECDARGKGWKAMWFKRI